MNLKPPAPRPCQSCPYRRDVPSGVWHSSEYAKLIEFDRPTYEQMDLGVFQCHQTSADDPASRVCGGWAHIHGADSLYLRLRAAMGQISPQTYEAIACYESPVPLFASGTEAAEHGMREISNKSPEAEALIDKITRVRADVHGYADE